MPGNDPRAPSFSAGRIRRRPERAADEGFRFDLFRGSRAPGEDYPLSTRRFESG
jgi:hypothetical protein